MAPWEHTKAVKDLRIVSTIDLLKRLDKAIEVKEPDQDNRKYDYKEAHAIIDVLSFRLEYTQPNHINEETRKQISRLSEGIEELNKRFENHRHPKEKTYTDKPVW